MRYRDWTNPRDGRHWNIWLRRSTPPVLVFGSGGERHTVVVDFDDGLEDRSDGDLRVGGAPAWPSVAPSC